MFSTPLSAELKGQIAQDLIDGVSYINIKLKHGVSHGTVSEIAMRLRAEGKLSKKERGSANVVFTKTKEADAPLSQTVTEKSEIQGDSWNIILPKTRICTLDALLEHCQVDVQLWEVVRYVCNKWEMAAKIGSDGEESVEVTPLFQVKATLKKRSEVQDARKHIADLKIEAMNWSPYWQSIPRKKDAKTDVVAELAVVDHHIGGQIWGKETGGADWDSKIALNCWKEAYETLIDRLKGYRANHSILVLGNDQQNYDNKAGSTEKLTPQISDSRYQKVYATNKEASRYAIERAQKEYGSVHVVMVPGNHDPLATFHLGDYLATWYRHNKAITIDNTEPLRKWFEWGKVMLMFEHGNNGKLPDYDRIMASTQPAMWGRTVWREAHTGHRHTKSVIEQKGAIIRSLPSLRPGCVWSVENHFGPSIRAAEAFAWSKNEGLLGQATYSVFK